MPVPKLPLHLTGTLHSYHRWWWRRTLRKRSVVTEWNERHQAIFVHVPKTAGTSLLAALGVPTVFDTHAPLRVYRDCYPDLFARAYSFAFVRNPWDRFASSFHFMRDGTSWPMQQQWAREHIGDLDFAAFTHRLANPLFRAQVMAERFFWPQTFWLEDGTRSCAVNDVFRFEALDSGIETLCARFGLTPPERTPHLRKVDKPSFRALYDDRMIDLVAQLYRVDIDSFGYTFE